MGPTTSLRHEIKQVFIPYLAGKGFSVDMRAAPQFLVFRRINAIAIDVCDIQWEKHGRPRFVVNFGKCGADGIVFRGKRIAPEDIIPFYGIFWGRLCPGSGGSTRSWFRQDRPLLERMTCWSKFYTPQEVVSTLTAMFSEVEEFWASGQIGPHIRLLPGPAKSMKSSDHPVSWTA
jgi:hypothetical protein